MLVLACWPTEGRLDVTAGHELELLPLEEGEQVSSMPPALLLIIKASDHICNFQKEIVWKH